MRGAHLGPGLEEALRKAMAALPAPLRQQVDELCSAVLVDQASGDAMRCCRQAKPTPTTSTARTYRLSRIQGLVLTDEPAVRPSDFDLAEAWAGVERDLSARIPQRATVELLAAPPSWRPAGHPEPPLATRMATGPGRSRPGHALPGPGNARSLGLR